MNTEAFIRQAAADGWSKTMTRQTLGMSTWKFWAILEAMPHLEWAGKGNTLGNKLGNASRRVTPAICAAAERARRAHREKALITWGDRQGTIEELAAFSPASARTIRRRIAEGMALDLAFTTPPNTTPPKTRARLRLNISTADI